MSVGTLHSKLDVRHLMSFAVGNVETCSGRRFKVGASRQYLASLGDHCIAASMCNSMSKRNPNRKLFANTMKDGKGDSGDTLHTFLELLEHNCLQLTWGNVYM